jgi:hypothetical protein
MVRVIIRRIKNYGVFGKNSEAPVEPVFAGFSGVF